MISNSTNQPIRILVDADSCPVVEEVTSTATEYGIPVILIASIAHYGRRPGEGLEIIHVDNIPQAADLAIINRVSQQDIVVTGDYGLASLVLARGASCVSPRGMVYTKDNIDRLLAERHIGAKIRRGGGRTKGPRAFTLLDKEKFVVRLCRLIEGKLNDS